MQFQTDVKRGESGEIIWKQILEAKGCTVERNPYLTQPRRAYYDLSVVSKGKEFTLESKIDFLSAVTGNISIEHTALNNSQADYYGYFILTPYLIKTADLHWLAFNPDFKVVTGGDGGVNNPQTLVPINSEAFKKYFKTLNGN